MIISGRDIAENIYQNLQKRIGELQKKNIIPHLVVLLIGDDSSSISYIRQKQKAAERLNAKLTILHLPLKTTTDEVIQKITQYNKDSSVHGIIVQKPFPAHLDGKKIDESILPAKDIDGFNSRSPFVLALPLAIRKILDEIYTQDQQKTQPDILSWLKNKHIVIMGKGETAGKPIGNYFTRLGIQYQVIDSQTPHPDDITRQADILIPAVGKKEIVSPKNIQPGVILIGVGMHMDESGKLKGEYDEEQIKDIASFYTTTPGGVGPANVACLMENLILAAELQTS